MNTDATAEVVDDVVDQPVLTSEASSESSTEAAEKPEDKSSGVQKRIDTLTAKRYEAEREAEALRRENAELKAVKPKAVAETVDAPELPSDMYDSEAMGKYHRDMVAYSAKVARSESDASYNERQRADLESRQKTDMQQVVSAYATNAIRDGVDMDKLRAAEQVLNESGISPQLGEFIMKDPNGGKIVEYLHDNPSVMHEVLALDPMNAGIKITSEIKALALSTTPRVSNAPEPTPDIKGGGVLEKDDFERQNPGTEFI